MSENTRKLVFCSACIALATVTSMIRLFRFPFGGSVTLCCMLFVFLPAWFYGLSAGLLCGLCYGLLQFVTGPFFMSVPQFLFDYVFAFMIMGCGALLSNRKNGLTKGYLLAVFGRFIMASIAGLIWIRLGSETWEGWAPLPYSLCYNGAYIFTEALVTCILINIPVVQKALERIKAEARR